MSTVALKNNSSHLLLCPEIGGSIARYTWREQDILRPATVTAIAEKNIRAMACYPLVPYSNRIGNAQLQVGAETFSLTKNFPPEPHAIHGIGWKRPWILGFHDSAHATLALTHTRDTDWPFAFHATQTFTLTEHDLQIILTIKNTDTRAMPVGLGFHPFFATPAEEKTTLKANWRGMWEMGVDKLPTQHVAVPPAADFRRAKPIANWQVDHCFTGWDQRARLVTPTHALTLTASAACSAIVCYAHRAWLALEPVTNINNAFQLAALGVENTGTRMLLPAESFSITFTIHCAPR